MNNGILISDLCDSLVVYNSVFADMKNKASKPCLHPVMLFVLLVKNWCECNIYL